MPCSWQTCHCSGKGCSTQLAPAVSVASVALARPAQRPQRMPDAEGTLGGSDGPSRTTEDHLPDAVLHPVFRTSIVCPREVTDKLKVPFLGPTAQGAVSGISTARSNLATASVAAQGASAWPTSFRRARGGSGTSFPSWPCCRCQRARTFLSFFGALLLARRRSTFNR